MVTLNPTYRLRTLLFVASIVLGIAFTGFSATPAQAQTPYLQVICEAPGPGQLYYICEAWGQPGWQLPTNVTWVKLIGGGTLAQGSNVAALSCGLYRGNVQIRVTGTVQGTVVSETFGLTCKDIDFNPSDPIPHPF